MGDPKPESAQSLQSSSGPTLGVCRRWHHASGTTAEHIYRARRGLHRKLVRTSNTGSRGYLVSTGCFTHLHGVYFGERIIDVISSYQALYLHLHILRRLQHALASVSVSGLARAHLRTSVGLCIADYRWRFVPHRWVGLRIDERPHSGNSFQTITSCERSDGSTWNRASRWGMAGSDVVAH